MARVAIVVISYNSADHIGACLDSLAEEPDVEILVVDNASQDGTLVEIRRRPFVRCIANTQNAGFAGAVNQAVAATEAPLILLLNPDTSRIWGISLLAAEFSDSRVGAAGGMLTDSKGAPQKGFMYRKVPSSSALMLEVLGVNRVWPRNHVNWHYRCLGNDPEVPCVVEQPAGAFLMFSRQVWNWIGGFDERFHPVWFEDVDFCTRLKAAGLLVKYNPRAKAQHAGGHSVSALELHQRERYWYGSLLKYAAKHYHSFTYRMICLAAILGSLFRCIRSLPSEGVKSFAVYGAVCRLAAFRLFQPRKVV